jgi:hypothetical protein
MIYSMRDLQALLWAIGPTAEAFKTSPLAALVSDLIAASTSET